MVAKINSAFPLVLLGLCLGIGLGTLGADSPIADQLRSDSARHWALLCLWPFFLFLGAEIDFGTLRRSGLTIAFATLGGVIVPIALTALLSGGNLWVAMGGAATDVALSTTARQLTGVVGIHHPLLLLAVGDDVLGVILMTIAFGAHPRMLPLVLAIAIVVGMRWVGRKTSLSPLIERAVWFAAAVVCSAALEVAGIEMLLGATFVLAIAPAHVRHDCRHQLRHIVPICLLLFGMQAGAINLLSAESWGTVTIAALFGGFLGKIIGITAGGFLGKRISGEAGITNAELIGIAVCGAVNATVAIIFVSVAVASQKIGAVTGDQAILGFLLTAPLAMAAALAYRHWHRRVSHP